MVVSLTSFSLAQYEEKTIASNFQLSCINGSHQRLVEGLNTRNERLLPEWIKHIYTSQQLLVGETSSGECR